MTHCPITAQWEEMLTDQMPAHQEAEFEAHLQECPSCREQLEELTHPRNIERLGTVLQAVSRKECLPESKQQQFLHRLFTERDAAVTDDQPLPTILGYEVLRRIGQGGSSTVYAARDTKLQRMVAIKLLKEQASFVQRQRFHKEAQSLASLQHPNVARIFDVGETAEQPYLILEFISAGSLAHYLQSLPQPADQCARVVQQLASAIQKAHETGFIHRDLKPGNILLEPHFGKLETQGLDRYLPKIIDFGIARDVERLDHLTNTRDFLGTPSYMAPEQITHSGHFPADHRMDVYALGIILYEMLTGRPPFRAVSPIDTMLQIRHEEPVPPRRLEPTVPGDLQNICLRCIEKDPAKRYDTAQALADDLDCYLQGKPVSARPISRLTRAWRWSKRNPGWALAASLLVLMLLTAAIGGPLLAHRERQLREAAAFQTSRATAHLDTAGQVLEEMLDRLLTNMRLQDPAYEDVQRGMVLFAIPYLEDFVKQDEASNLLKLRQARSLLQLAMVQVRNQELDKAEHSYHRAMNQMKALQPSETLKEATLWKSLSSVHLEFGRFLQMYRHHESLAEQHYRQSLDYLNKLDLRDDKQLDAYAILYSLLATVVDHNPGQSDDERNYLLKAVDYRKKLVERHPDRDDLRHYLAMTHLNASIFFRRMRHTRDHIDQLRHALALEKQIQQSKTMWIDAPYQVSVLSGELGVTLMVDKQNDEGMKLIREGKTIADALVIAYPMNKKYTAQSENLRRVIEHYEK